MGEKRQVSVFEKTTASKQTRSDAFMKNMGKKKKQRGGLLLPHLSHRSRLFSAGCMGQWVEVEHSPRQVSSLPD